MSVLVNIYGTLTRPPEPTFNHELVGFRDQSDPELAEHLNGFIGYVMNRGGQMTARRYHVYRHIQRVKHHWSMNIEEDDWDAFEAWVTQVNGICFLPDGTVRDAAGRVLALPGDGEPDDDSQVPYPADAWQRKAATEARLKKAGIPFLPSLPPVVGVGEVEFREPADVAWRMLALALVAVLAESIASKERIPTEMLKEKSPLSFKGLSPRELAFVNAKAPTEQEVINFAWRYEALAALEWSLGLIELSAPSKICDVPKVAGTALDSSNAEFIKNAKLRPAAAILDALDLHYRLHWATTQARIDQKPPPAGLEPGVISERCYALNWLVRFEGSDWDDVEVPS